jgi:VWFA-related protein
MHLSFPKDASTHLMKRQLLIAGLLLQSAFIFVFAQKPTVSPSSAQSTPPAPRPSPSPAQSPAPEISSDDVVRITANLVQIDAVVTDSKGRQITDLTDQDFEILEDGRSQKITNLSYVSIKSSPVATSPSPANTKGAAAGPPVTIRPEAVHRTIALVVDDLGLSFESTAYVREALKKFVEQQMQAGDLVAIIRTRAGTGPLQQFTADKRLLYAAIDRIRWNPNGTGLIGAFAPLDLDPLTKLKIRAASTIPGGLPAVGDATNQPGNATARLEQFRKEIFSVGTVGALKFVVEGMRSLPGRKAVILMSDGISIFDSLKDDGGRHTSSPPKEPGANRVMDALRQLTDFANRASVVIYTMDARGLQTLGLTAGDNTDDQSSGTVRDGLSNRQAEFINSQEGLNYLSQQTGGFLIHDTNDLSRGIEKVLDDQKGYYLIGYRPDDSTFNANGQRSFHRLTVHVKRAGLKVRARTGFYGITDEENRAAAKSGDERMAEALISPFSSADVHLRMTSLFGNDAQNQPVMRALLHIDGRDLTFADVEDGWHQIKFEIVAVTFGDGGVVVDKFARNEQMRVREDAFRQAQKHGLIYTLNVPLHRAGAYQLRVAVRDEDSNRIGAASQFIEVPDLKKGELALSGIVMAGIDPASTSAQAPGTSTSRPETVNSELEAQANPAVRRMCAGMLLNYAYSVYNAVIDKRTHQPQLQTQVRLFRGTDLIYTGKLSKLATLDGPQQSNSKQRKPISAVGTFQLGSKEEPGDYFLEVIVTDLLADKNHNTTVSWIDFEVLQQ